MAGDRRKPEKELWQWKRSNSVWKVLDCDNVYLSKIIVNTHVPSEDQIQDNTEESQEGTQGQRQDPRARCFSFPFLQSLLFLGGSVSRTSL